MSSRLRHGLSVMSSLSASILTAGRGVFVVREAKQPEKPLILYEYEGCPYCRRVREALTALHLDVEIRPCPRGGKRFRPEAEAIGGKALFPFFIDENTGERLYESADIVRYLFRVYGEMEVPDAYRPGTPSFLLSGGATAIRSGRGIKARPSRAPEKPLSLTSFEGSPFSRLVRERMTELELPYTLHNLGKEAFKELGPATRRITPNPYIPKEGGKRYRFYQKHGRVQVPYLEDPNRGIALFESTDIIDYLEKTYAL
ncbi:MAG: glutathione S-transferase [Sandaracinaceae bacterium]|nr:glutathione S-transferase [Sandaracinaceae bacterium]